MKKYLVLTSVLALTACGGGGGSGDFGGHAAHPTTPGNPPIHMQGFSGGQTVHANNATLTNMSSYTVNYTDGYDENDAKNAMIVYVVSHLGGLRGNLNRAASSRNRDVADPTEFALADAAITEMKQVLYDMVGKPSNAALRTYVTRYRYAVVNALKMQDVDVTNETSIDDLVAAFNTLKSDKSWTIENIMAALDTFDETNFHITKFRMEDEVQLKDTGQDAFFKFALDDTGKISSVSLWENPTADYGASWTTNGASGQDKKIVINEDGNHAVWVNGQGLNPFGAEGTYLNSNAGDLVRNSTSNAFTNTVHRYFFNLPSYGGETPLSVIGADEFTTIGIDSGEELTLDSAKQKLKDYIIAKVNKKLHNQQSENESDLAGILAIADWYINYIDTSDTITQDFVNNASSGTFTQTATMDGVGKDVGLRYSDFGYATMVRDMGYTTTQYLTYVGGYDNRRMDNSVVNDDLDGVTFTGTGIITVEDTHQNKNQPDTDYKHTALYKDTTAQLQYDVTGAVATHTLTMNNLKAVEGTGASTGSDWYSMVVSGTEGSPIATIHFDDQGGSKNINEEYKFFEMDGDAATRTQGVVATNGTAVNINTQNGTPGAGDYGANYKLHADVSAEYYGENPTDPSEATAGFYMSERYHSDDNRVQHELSVYGAFGGTRDE